MITRPSQLPGVVRFDPLNDYEDHCAAEAEARAALWLQRVQWFAFGVCAGFLILWASITF
jgi:hypothetical protein